MREMIKFMIFLAEQSNGVMGTGCVVTVTIITMPQEPIAIGTHVLYFIVTRILHLLFIVKFCYFYN